MTSTSWSCGIFGSSMRPPICAILILSIELKVKMTLTYAASSKYGT